MDFTYNNDIISYLSWAEANDISPFGEEDDSYDEDMNEKEDEKVKIKSNVKDKYKR